MDDLSETLARLTAQLGDAARGAWAWAAPWREMLSDSFDRLVAWAGNADLALPRDIAVVLAVLLGALAIPSVLSAVVDRRLPLIGVALGIAAAAIAVWTLGAYPGDWTFEDLPMAFVTVVARLLD